MEVGAIEHLLTGIVAFVAGLSPWLIKLFREWKVQERADRKFSLKDRDQLLEDARRERDEAITRADRAVAQHARQIKEQRLRYRGYIDDAKKEYRGELDKVHEEIRELRTQHQDCLETTARLSERVIHCEKWNERAQGEIEMLESQMRQYRKDNPADELTHNPHKLTDQDMEQPQE